MSTSRNNFWRTSVFTTGQAAAICHVAPRTIAKWFDSGQLKGYRVPGSQDRRIPRSYLLRFMQEHQFPTEALSDQRYRILLFSDEKTLGWALEDALDSQRHAVTTACDTFHFGMEIASANCLVVDVESTSPVETLLARFLRWPALRKLPMFLIASRSVIKAELINVSEGHLEIFRRPFDPQLLAERIRATA